MNEGRQNSVTRRGLIRGSALGAAGIGALAAPALFGSAPASAAVAPGLSWTNVVTDFGADPTGARDSTSNFQSAINAGLPVYVPPGTYLCSAGPLLVAPYTRIFGNSYGGTTITTTGAPLFNMDSVAGTGGNAPPPIEGIEIDHLTLSASSTGGDIFWGANIVRSSVHHCKLVQNNPASAIYNCSASTGQSPAGTTYMAECRFYQLDANARQITIDTPSQYGPGQTLVIDAGNAANVTLLGSPGAGNYTLRNGSGVKVLS